METETQIKQGLREEAKSKLGYKKSKFGWIPNEWKIKQLGEDGVLLSGLTYSPKDVVQDGLLVLRSSNIKNDSIVFDDNVYVRKEGIKYNSVKEGDILICVRNGSKSLIGKNALINEKCEGMAFGAFMSVYRSECNGFFIHLFKTDFYLKEIHRNLGATINSINGSDLRKFSFPLPPPPEQRKIAEILSTWDKAIERTQNLIEQLKLRKKGLMQQLLTGKTRLNGFSGEWKEVQLGKYISFYKKKSSNSDSYPVFSSSKKGLIMQSDYYGGDNRITSRDIEGFNIIPPEHATYRSRSDDGVFTFNINNHNKTGVVSKYYPVFKCIKANQNFIIQTLNYYHNAVRRYAVGTSQLVLSEKDLRQLKFHLPNHEEQDAINMVLTTADNEIKAQENYLAQLQAQKKGLMQQLLTGKKRVKV